MSGQATTPKNLKREKVIAEIKSLKFFFADYLLQNCSDKQLEEILSLSREMEKLRASEKREKPYSANKSGRDFEMKN
jgi:hypothetical protein